jgi:CRP-like cAMP-binding protein
MDDLFRHIARFARLGAADQELLSATLKERTLKKKEYLLKEGQVCTANYFILKGCFRMYYVNNKGVDQIVQFGIDSWWITDYMSYLTATPSLFCIQAVEPSRVLVWRRQDEDSLLQQIPALERYFRLILQRTVAAAQQRSKYDTDFSGEERYHHFLSHFPEFVQRVPQYMLASYLGFTPEFLSKIRAGKT